MAPRISRYGIPVLAVLSLGPGHSFAQGVAELPIFDAPEGTAALGGGIRLGRNIYLSDDSTDERQQDLVPLYLYEGKYFFARGISGGVHVVRREAFEFNLLAQYRFNRLESSRAEGLDGIETRRQTVDAGVEFQVRGGWGEFQVRWLGDTLDRHAGQTASALYRYRFDRGRLAFSPFVSYSLWDAKLSDYYYGVSAAEATLDRPEYSPGQSSWFGIGLNAYWWLSDNAALFANIGFGSPSSDINNSPIVEEDAISSTFIGGTYVFGNARRPDAILTPERRSEWSWRVSYGYQADGQIVTDIDKGNFKKSNTASTNVGGVTFSKLLSDGPRMDYVGRVAWWRHFEGDEGNGNFNSYAAYIMMIGKGYSPWSDKELFRWGFGFGVSYAQEVPILEQRKQGERDRNTSQLLNYLEMTVDFPVRRFSKSRRLENCYVGLTNMHRSGIFGTADLFDNVFGGADWIMAHLECAHR